MKKEDTEYLPLDYYLSTNRLVTQQLKFILNAALQIQVF